ncbi:hypothetical protein SEA_TRIBUTE_182 [Streptomyces phage Tribute]|jgi:hypothetical protein|nr:hypothetical protein SEA_TEUTSCH_183 [Streptomyces phage Teutsch]QGH78336.1 hypothetical protein SEA_TRIBUTE_182 [Streptomyces phage Tribute]QRI46138.1 hypothetical protein SEA_CROSS_184 [Streptomyces phage Cross]WNN95507.1 hypothetical protein SEA_WATERMOORE_183 [Streptomyces phage Watermoore]
MAREYKIWVDDERPAPDETWTRMKNSVVTVLLLKALKRRGLVPRAISLDHDLGLSRSTGLEDTTRPVVLWMCEQEFWPEKVYVHTANPVGREWLEGMVNHYGPGVSR